MLSKEISFEEDGTRFVLVTSLWTHLLENTTFTVSWNSIVYDYGDESPTRRIVASRAPEEMSRRPKTST